MNVSDIIDDPDRVEIQSRTIDGAQWRCRVYYKDNRRHIEVLERE